MGRLGVSVGTAVTVTFSEAMNPSTITNGTITLSNSGWRVGAEHGGLLRFDEYGDFDTQ